VLVVQQDAAVVIEYDHVVAAPATVPSATVIISHPDPMRAGVRSTASPAGWNVYTPGSTKMAYA